MVKSLQLCLSMSDSSPYHPQMLTQWLISNWRMDGWMNEWGPKNSCYNVRAVSWQVLWGWWCECVKNDGQASNPCPSSHSFWWGNCLVNRSDINPMESSSALTSVGWGFLFSPLNDVGSTHFSNCTLCGWYVMAVLCCDLYFYELWELRTYQF